MTLSVTVTSPAPPASMYPGDVFTVMGVVSDETGKPVSGAKAVSVSGESSRDY